MHDFTSIAVCTLAVNWSLTVLAFLAIIAICWVGLILPSARPSLDDVLVIMAFLISMVLVSLSTWAIVDEGLGRHQQDVSASHLEIAAKSVLVSEALWTLVTGLLRITAGLFICRIFRPPALGRRITIGIMALSAALAIASIIQIFLICQPFAAQWDPNVVGSCGDQVVSFISMESMGLLLDIGIFIIPSITIINLQLPVSTRTALALIANVGAV
ncbi:integral membrane protein [Diaporthe helianthi]|uniref:Integral membrane protein n=1 Tax=Diaporthe helianthi TaxID=158607 RepID=A0A2P5HNY6_DIAHE|nr:integral membrane protein [Diaporthe helianthi]